MSNDIILFGEDNDISCFLLSDNEESYFEAYLKVSRERRAWYDRKFDAGNEMETHRLFVLCKTLPIFRVVNALTDIPSSLIELREKQAAKAGACFHTTETESNFHAMVYLYCR